MIKASELRIGNLIESLGSALVVDTLSSNGNARVLTRRGSNVALSLSQCKPIPITEEWLIKFGGKCTIMEGYPIYYLNPFDIEFYELESIIHIANGEFKIKYVHQLQNLYYALTNEELTIK